MIARQLVVLSERRSVWGAQLRPRLQDRPVIWRETRGTNDLLSAVEGWPCPIVLLDLGTQPREGLERLVQLSVLAPSALVLGLDRHQHPGLHDLARTLGATQVWSGFAPPPDVAKLIDRWLILARHRTALAGRAALPKPDPDPSDPMALLEV
ncbi:hypothetical protein [Tautonia rosea]|uniref:hypothetical protein n=1 Tax=Tautonia rosea TaxID=2728037 RepID=UPI0014743FBA|nr:hypothetical protein [Tautonia rosea]